MVFGGENAESYYDEGVTVAMKGDVRKAVELFSKAIRMDNSNPAAYHQLAKCYVRLGDAQNACNLLEQVVQKKPDSTPARLDYGYALIQNGRLDMARKQFNEIIHKEPQSARGSIGLAHVYFQEGAWAETVSTLQQALLVGAPDFSALMLLGKAARLSGNRGLSDASLEKAEKVVKQTIESSPSSPEGHYLRGEVCFAQERYSDALESYRQSEVHCEPHKVYSAYRESFSIVDALAKQGLCYQRLGQFDRARELGDRIVAIIPQHAIGKALQGLT